MTQELDLRGNTVYADGFVPSDIVFDGDASDIDLDGTVAGVSSNVQAALVALDGKDAGDIEVGTALQSPGEGINIASDDTIVEALTAILAFVDDDEG